MLTCVNWRLHAAMGPSTSHRIIGEKEKVENKRLVNAFPAISNVSDNTVIFGHGKPVLICHLLNKHCLC